MKSTVIRGTYMLGKNSNYKTIFTRQGTQIYVQLDKNNGICDILPPITSKDTQILRSELLNIVRGRQYSTVVHNLLFNQLNDRL